MSGPVKGLIAFVGFFVVMSFVAVIGSRDVKNPAPTAKPFGPQPTSEKADRSAANDRMGQLVFTVAICAALYFIPAIVGRKKPNAGAIFALNLLLGWTVLGWIVALVWAMTGEKAEREKICPACRERVKAKALKCRFCGTEFESVTHIEA